MLHKLFNLFKTNIPKKSIYDIATETLKNSQTKIAKGFIKIINQEVSNQSKKGYAYALIYYNRYGVIVKQECLKILIEYYEKLGFEVEVCDRDQYPSCHYIALRWS